MAARHDLSPQALAKARRRLARPGTTRGTGLTPRIRKAVEAFVHGIPGLPVDQVVTRKVAADYAGIKERSFAQALLKPAVDQYFHAQMKALRVGERPQNVRALVAIRDDASLKGSAAGARARVAAVAQLEVDPDVRAGINVNINSTVNVTEKAGYVIDLSGHPAEPLTIDHDPTGERDRVTLDDDDQYEGAAPPPRAPAGAPERGGGEKSRSSTQFLPDPRESPLAETPADYFSPNDENLIRRTDLLPGSLGTLAPGSRTWPKPSAPPRSRRHGPGKDQGH